MGLWCLKFNRKLAFGTNQSFGWWFQIVFTSTPKHGEDFQFDSYFSTGLKPPTSLRLLSIPSGIRIHGWLILLILFKCALRILTLYGNNRPSKQAVLTVHDVPLSPIHRFGISFQTSNLKCPTCLFIFFGVWGCGCSGCPFRGWDWLYIHLFFLWCFTRGTWTLQTLISSWGFCHWLPAKEMFHLEWNLSSSFSRAVVSTKVSDNIGPLPVISRGP